MSEVNYVPATSRDAGAVPVNTPIATHDREADGAQVQDVYIEQLSSGDVIETGFVTGLKGLRVFLRGSDPISDLPVFVDYNHHQNHEGESYQYTYPLTAINNGVTKWFRLVVPVYSPVIQSPHIYIEVDTLAQTTIALYEGPTASGGNLATTYNRNRNSANTAKMTIYTAPTVNANGTLLDQRTVGDATAGVSASTVSEEWILKSNTSYLIGLTANSTQDSVAMRIRFYEDLGV